MTDVPWSLTLQCSGVWLHLLSGSVHVPGTKAIPVRYGDQQPAMAMHAGYYLARLMFAAPVSTANQKSTQSALDGFIIELDHDLERGIFDANGQLFAW
ncbi:hypothetical protein PG997_011250 [Apiospora hydei]|uniref:Uncharacterized protein n=1 Tax=Apiospora hydei TaxID=1337664 RepID=A0ABR1VJI4_9PEZI